jgi:hypothetical protein
LSTVQLIQLFGHKRKIWCGGSIGQAVGPSGVRPKH